MRLRLRLWIGDLGMLSDVLIRVLEIENVVDDMEEIAIVVVVGVGSEFLTQMNRDHVTEKMPIAKPI